MDNIMVDLETMGTGASCAIISIGAVAFDIKEKKLGETFYSLIDLHSSVKNGGIIEPGTVLWWMGNDDNARKSLLEKGENIIDVLYNFSKWIETFSSHEKIKVWGDGATFDNVILSTTYKNCNLKRPWDYRHDRCYRTIKNFYPDIKIEKNGTLHNALDDAKNQALHLIAMLNSNSFII